MLRKANPPQPTLPLALPAKMQFPQTRYQGSKLKIAGWIWENIADLDFETALDAFGGTGSVSYALKTHGKQVSYNDWLRFNYLTGVALIENTQTALSEADVDWLLSEHPDVEYPTFIRDTFSGIYYLDEENRWLDVVSTNIRGLTDRYKQSLAYYALSQACIIKRPFNLFHRKNLYIRTSNVPRTFGNKTTWDTPFEIHFRNFVVKANDAVFDNGKQNRALNYDALSIPGEYDLVYIDPPYVSSKGLGVDYFGFYHFLEGITDYETWKSRIDWQTKHRRLKGNGDDWVDKGRIYDAFDRLFERFRRSILVVSYRAPGIPTEEELVDLLRKHKGSIERLHRKEYQYVLSPNGGEELLLIAV
jgi:adenine-specific DNA-methyltransferase